MTKDHEIQEKHIKKAITYTGFLSSLGGLLIGLFVIYGFYYNTKDTQAEHSSSIHELKTDVKEIKLKINSAEIFQGVSQAEQKALQDKVVVIEKKMDKVDDKLDRILEQTRR